ncbi:MAG: signal peptide peptidase SppA [Pirellulaceae bacterium]
MMLRRSFALSLLLLMLACMTTARADDDQEAKKEKPEKAAAVDEAKQQDKDAEGKQEEAKTTKARVASIVIKGNVGESAGQAGLFGELSENLLELVQRLDRAAQDENIDGVLLKLREAPSGRGRIAELRAAIGRIREAGKKVVAEMDSGSTSEYLLASACDGVVMPESGVLMIPGVRAEVTFYKGLFDKLGVEADMLQVGDFKGAAEPFTRNEMSPEFRKQLESVIDGFYGQMVDMIAADRKLERKKVTSLIDQGMLTASAARKAGLIDTLAYGDQVEDLLKKRLDVDQIYLVKDYGKKEVDTDFSGTFGMMKLMNMMMGVDTQQSSSSRPKVALVYAVGPIMTGKSTSSLFGEATVGSETIVKALREAADDETVKAIVLRVDSPGGSALASDLMWREITRIEKPVIASMGDTAASGGYYISMGCDKIYAEAGTLTGSIGVVGGKVAVGGLLDKVGVSSEVISRGKNANLMSMTSKFTDGERKVWKAMMEDIYRQFTTKAAKGRKMDVKKLEGFAGGRVWTGRQAKEIGLVDEIGTLRDALYAAKAAAGMGKDDKAELLVLPKPQNFFDELFGGAAAHSGVKSGIDAVAPEISEHLQDLETLRRLFAEPGALILPCRIEIR